MLQITSSYKFRNSGLSLNIDDTWPGKDIINSNVLLPNVLFDKLSAVRSIAFNG